MKLIFLGTSAGAPTRTRNVTAVALQWVQQGRVWLFDCGEGTQQQFQYSPVKLSHLDRIFVSHLHGDHVFGLPGLLASRSAAQNVLSELTIAGPRHLDEYLRTSLSLTHTKIKYPWKFELIGDGVIYEDEYCTVECRLLKHGIPSYGFAINEKDHPGEFNPSLALEMGVPPGPLYGILKSGADVTLPDGRIVRAAGLVGPPKKGRKIVISGDTGATSATVDLAKGASVLVHEATFMSDQLARAIEIGHSTAAQAAEVARAAGVGRLILTHFSPRYDQDGASLMPDLLAEAQAIFPLTILAEDFLVVDVDIETSD